MDIERGSKRFASPNEQRTISREDVGFYHAVIVGALYHFNNSHDVLGPQYYFKALQYCVEKHPFLNVVVEDADTDKAWYRKVQEINLRNHVSITNSSGSSLSAIEEALSRNIDEPFLTGIPPWKIEVLLLSSGTFIAFCFSHPIGDGPFGMEFHRTFLQSYRNNSSDIDMASHIVKTTTMSLPEPFDTPERLPISWSFLLAPLTSLFLPSLVTRSLGLRASASATNEGTWVGSEISFDSRTPHSKLKMREIKTFHLENALRVARVHDAKLTGTLQQIIARALSKVITDPTVTNFVCQTAINMKGAIGVPRSEDGDYVSGCYCVHKRSSASDNFTHEDWDVSRFVTQQLAQSATTLHDQAIGLLRYLPSIRKWTLGKVGTRRDCSFEVSNIGAFHDGEEEGKLKIKSVEIESMIFAQPGHVISAPLAFNFASVRAGSLFYTVTWQAGALKLPNESEDAFVEQICDAIDHDLSVLA